jgi:hypothetical protein
MKPRRTNVVTGLFIVLCVLGVIPIAYAGSLEPSAAPGPTMKTLDQIPPTWDQILPGSTRFQLVMGGVGVLDKETGLVWEQTPHSAFIWHDALVTCATNTKSHRKGWRLPTIQELSSLIDDSVSPGPTIPSGNPFSNVLTLPYWSSTTRWDDSNQAWVVNLSDGTFNYYPKGSSADTWCVRGGAGLDAQ